MVQHTQSRDDALMATVTSEGAASRQWRRWPSLVLTLCGLSLWYCPVHKTSRSPSSSSRSSSFHLSRIHLSWWRYYILNRVSSLWRSRWQHWWPPLCVIISLTVTVNYKSICLHTCFLSHILGFPADLISDNFSECVHLFPGVSEARLGKYINHQQQHPHQVPAASGMVTNPAADKPSP